MTAMKLGIALGLFIEITRKLIKRTARYQKFVNDSAWGRPTDFVLDAVLLASPYASSFGGFVELPAVLWWTAGGVFASLYDAAMARRKANQPVPAGNEVPSDMSTMSLVGGGLIAGDSLSALSVGIWRLLKTVIFPH
jgi:hypothetical protein